MADGRQAPRRGVLGQVEPRVGEVLQDLTGQAADGSTHTAGYHCTRVGQAVRKLEGPPLKMLSRATFYRLAGRLEAWRHTTGSGPHPPVFGQPARRRVRPGHSLPSGGS
jgi:hypothetical protein